MTLNDINIILAKRYFEKLSKKQISKDIISLLKMCITIIEKDMPEDKSSRWIGYVQGVMISNNILDLEEERNFTRPLFQKYYRYNNIYSPTVNANETEIRKEYSYEELIEMSPKELFDLFVLAKEIRDTKEKTIFIF